MKSPDTVFSELAKLYDFHREIVKFRQKKKSRKRNTRNQADAPTSRPQPPSP